MYTFSLSTELCDTELITSKELQCFIHDVSPTQEATSSKRKYFNFTVQSKNKAVRAVCFLPDRQPELRTLQQVKTPVKLENFTTSSSGAKQDLIITKYTKITPLKKDDIDFTFSDELQANEPVTNISAIHKLAPEQLITVKAEIVSVSSVKAINTQHSGKLNKQEVIIRDTTSSVKVVLWQDYVNSLEVNKTYELQNLRIKTSGKERFLNTAKSEKFIFKETTPFQHPLVNVDEDFMKITSVTILCKVIGIQQIYQNLSCISCQKKVVTQPGQDITQCQSCNMTQLVSSCKVQRSARLLVEDTKDPKQHIRLMFGNAHLSALLSSINPSLNMITATEKDILSHIAKANKVINITYDKMNYRVLEIDIS